SSRSRFHAVRMSSRKADRRRRRTELLVPLMVAVAFSACAPAGGLVRAGRQAERVQDYDRAVIEYSNAAKQRPHDVDLRVALERVKIRASLEHFAKGRRLAGMGKLEEGLTELQVAGELNPTSTEIDDQLRQTRTALRSKIAVTREGKTRLE